MLLRRLNDYDKSNQACCPLVRSREKKLLPRVGAAEELYVAPIMSQSRGTIQVKKVRLRLSNKNERNSFGFEEHQDHRGFKTSRACTNSNPLSLKEPKSPAERR